MANTLYDYYTEQKKPLPSISERASLYEQHGLGSAADYAGRSDQNIALLGKLTGQQAQTSPEMPATSPITAKTGVVAGGGVNVAVKPNMGQVSTTQTSQTPVIDPIEQKKQIMAQIDAKLRDFQLAQQKDDSTTYLKKVEDLATNPPETPDWGTMWADMAKTQGMETEQAELQGIDAQIADFQAQVDKETYKEENRTSPMSIINLRKNKIRENANIELDRLYGRRNVVLNSIQNKQDTISNLMKFNQQTYSDTLANYNQKISAYKMMAEMMENKEDKEFDRARAEKSDAQANLKVIQDNVIDFVKAGKSFDELPDTLKAQIRNLEIQSGMPEGTTQQLLGELQPEEEEVWKGLSEDGTKLSQIIKKSDGTTETRLYATGLSPKQTDSGNVPSSYKEWSLAGGKEGTGKSYAEFLKGSKSGSETTQEEYQYERAERVITNVDDILGKVKWYNSGLLGWAMQNVGGTPGYNLDKMVDQLKANIGFQELQAMRAASPTGGALGQVAVRELELLQSVLGSLEVGQSTGQLKENLGKVKTHFENWKAAVDKANGTVQGGQSNANFVVDGFQFPTQEAANAYKKEMGYTE